MMALRIMALVWFAGIAAGQDIEIPFEFLHNQIVLRANINGRGPYTLVLDSGTHGSTVDIELAKRLRLPLSEGEHEGKGAGAGRAVARSTTLARVDLGGLVVTQLPATALDLSKVSRALGRPLDGVLGYGFLSGRIAQIDYFHRRVRFLAQPPAPSSSRRIEFPMQFRPNSVLPVLDECYVNGTKIPVTIDTGSSAGLILFPRTIVYLGLEELADQGIPLDAAGYRGKAMLTKGWARSVVLGGLDLGAIEVSYVRHGYGESEDPGQRGGNIGNAVLQDFALTLDYVNRKVILEAIE